MKFSVLCSVYYKENPIYLQESIESLYNQSIIPNQVVLVRDGEVSQDIKDVIEGFKKVYSNLDVIELPENLGLANALNIGLKHCKYNIVARMDTDDIACSNRFEIQLSKFKNNQDLVLVGSNISEFIGEKQNIVSQRKVPIEHKDILLYSKKRNPFNHMTVMFKKDKIEEVGGYLESLYTEDYYLWVRVLANQYICENIDDVLVLARIGNEMFARRGGFKYLKSDIALQQKFYRMGHINGSLLLYNIIIRAVVRLMPNRARKKLYIKKFR